MMNIIRLLIVPVLLLVLTGCLPSRDPTSVEYSIRGGFISGFIDGVQLPVSLVASFFDSKVAIYAVNNDGRPYSFGFFFGSMFLFALIRDMLQRRNSFDS